MAFATRLRDAAEIADLTGNDLARWFKRPRATIGTWLLQNREPRGPAGDVAYFDLQLLEWAVANDRSLPVPPRLSPRQRMAYINERYAYATRHARLPVLHSPAGSG
jgi:hypothetical protein